MLKKTLAVPAEIWALSWICICVFSAYNAPQPLFPSIQEAFSVPQSSISLITTCVILPLGLAPIFYGLALNRLPLIRPLTVALILYGMALLPVALGGNWWVLLAGRIIQGFTLPAIILCIMTYISLRYEGKTLQKYMTFYAISCMFGGFGGRIAAGYVEQLTGDWRMAFAFMAFSVFAALPCTRLLHPVKGSFTSVKAQALVSLFRQKGMLKLLLIAPCLVLVNTSILNILPFRLKEIEPSITSFEISIVYMGIIFCSAIGFFSMPIIRLLQSEMRALMLSIALFILFMPLLFVPSATALFSIMIGINAGYTFLYTSIPGIVNRFSTADKSVTNGAFLTSYYLSGAMGSYFPTIIYEQWGFSTYWICMLFLAFIALAMAFSMRGVVVDQKDFSAH